MSNNELKLKIRALEACDECVDKLFKQNQKLQEEITELKAILAHPCLRSLKPGEPFFVLKGQDITASEAVEHWILNNIRRLGKTNKKIISAQKKLFEMQQWLPRKYPD